MLDMGLLQLVIIISDNIMYLIATLIACVAHALNYAISRCDYYRTSFQAALIHYTRMIR